MAWLWHGPGTSKATVVGADVALRPPRALGRKHVTHAAFILPCAEGPLHLGAARYHPPREIGHMDPVLAQGIRNRKMPQPGRSSRAGPGASVLPSTPSSQPASCIPSPSAVCAGKGVAVLERHEVQSRDSIHKILHRSPAKPYRMRRVHPAAHENVVILPKHTLSKTYTEVSELQVSKDRFWVLHQQTRLGEFFADLLVDMHAIKVRPARSLSPGCLAAGGSSGGCH